MMTLGVSSDERRVREQISAEWGYPYDPLDDFALPGVGTTIAGGSLAAATQRAVDTFINAITRRSRESVQIARPKREAEKVSCGRLAPAPCHATAHKPGNSRAAMSRR